MSSTSVRDTDRPHSSSVVNTISQRVSLSPPMGSTSPPQPEMMRSELSCTTASGTMSPLLKETSVVQDDAGNFIHPSNDEEQDRNASTNPTPRQMLHHHSHSRNSCRSNDSSEDRFVLPKCTVLPWNEIEPIEVFVANAVREQHHQQRASETWKASSASAAAVSTVIVPNYKVMIDAFRLKKDIGMIHKLLMALRTSGSTLSLLASDSTIHARLLHHIVRFVPFASSTIIVKENKVYNGNDDENGTDDITNRMKESGEYDFSQIECDTSLADAQFHFLIALISANTVFLVPTITALWKMLTTGIFHAHPVRVSRIHATLATITRLCPKAKTELLPILQSNTPFRRKSQAELIFYYQQCLTVLEYIPHIRGPVIDIIIHRCLEIDVDIQITDHGEATIDVCANNNNNMTTGDDDDRASNDCMFQLDMDDDGKNTTVDNDTKQVNAATSEMMNMTVDETADKLDSLLLLVFQYIESILVVDSDCTTVSSNRNSLTTTQQYNEMFHILSRIFESAILITHKSKFVQFVILHICGLEESQLQQRINKATDTIPQPDASLLYREFASNLIHIILDPYKATVTRQSAACYLASFISRANYVCPETVCESIDALLRWAEAYIQSLASLGSIHAPDVRDQCNMHSLFYTVCQAAFYIMCFRGVEVVQFIRPSINTNDVNDPSLHIDLGTTRWTKLCVHPLVPLKYCLESVRTEFLRISKLFSLLDNDILNQLINNEMHNGFHPPQRKKKTSLISTPATLEKERLRGGVGGLGRGTNPLDSFFPFDPYLLLRSHSFIEPFYNHWDGGASADSYVPGDDNDDDAAIIVDGDSEDESTQQILDHDPNDDDSISDSDDDDGEEDDGTVDEPNNVIRRKRLMSFASNATSVSSRPSSVEDRHDDFLTAKRIEMKKAWSTIIKRPRAPSCSENGSW